MPKRKASDAQACKSKRTRHINTLSPDQMQALLGKVFSTWHCYRAPDVFRVVGWTKTKKSANLERVPLEKVGEDWHGNGTRKINQAWLECNPVQDADGNLLRKATLRAVPRFDDDGKVAMKFEKLYYLYEQTDLSSLFTFCDY